MIRHNIRFFYTLGLTWMIVITGEFSAAAQTALQRAFQARIEQAYKAEDRGGAITALFHLKGADEFVIGFYHRFTIPRLVRKSIKNLAFVPLPANFNVVYVQRGYEYRPNIKPLGYVVLNGTTKIPYGAHGGQYYFIGMTRRQINVNPPAEKTLQMIIIGEGHPPVKFEGACEIRQSNGKIRKIAIKDNGQGSITLVMTAVRIKYCEIVNLSGRGALSLRLFEGDKQIFKQRAEAPQNNIIEFVRPQ